MFVITVTCQRIVYTCWGKMVIIMVMMMVIVKAPTFFFFNVNFCRGWGGHREGDKRSEAVSTLLGQSLMWGLNP